MSVTISATSATPSAGKALIVDWLLLSSLVTIIVLINKHKISNISQRMTQTQHKPLSWL